MRARGDVGRRLLGSHHRRQADARWLPSEPRVAGPTPRPRGGTRAVGEPHAFTLPEPGVGPGGHRDGVPRVRRVIRSRTLRGNEHRRRCIRRDEQAPSAVLSTGTGSNWSRSTSTATAFRTHRSVRSSARVGVPRSRRPMSMPTASTRSRWRPGPPAGPPCSSSTPWRVALSNVSVTTARAVTTACFVGVGLVGMPRGLLPSGREIANFVFWNAERTEPGTVRGRDDLHRREGKFPHAGRSSASFLRRASPPGGGGDFCGCPCPSREVAPPSPNLADGGQTSGSGSPCAT